jgi:chromate reductase, NAD(P)H dehydrogenase (quinone)
MRILGISGSLRRDSLNTRLLRAAAETLPPGVELELYTGLGAIPPFNADAEDDPPRPVRELNEAIAGADALLIATPEYNASIPGVLKNAIDWASRPFPDNALRDHPVAVVGASTGLFGAVWAQAEVRKALRHAGARVLNEVLPVANADGVLGPEGGLDEPELAACLEELLVALVREAQGALEAEAQPATAL